MSFVDFADLKVGKLIVMKERYPCKIVRIDTSAPGKHGHAKKSTTGIDIMTGKKYISIYTHHSHIKAPIVDKFNYEVVDIGDDGFLSLLEENGELREDIRVEGDQKEELENALDDAEERLMVIMLVVVKIDDNEMSKIESWKYVEFEI